MLGGLGDGLGNSRGRSTYEDWMLREDEGAGSREGACEDVCERCLSGREASTALMSSGESGSSSSALCPLSLYTIDAGPL